MYLTDIFSGVNHYGMDNTKSIKPIHVEVEADVWEVVKTIAARENRSAAGQLRTLMRQWVMEHEPDLLEKGSTP